MREFAEDLTDVLDFLKYPDCFSNYLVITPETLPINALARLKCAG